MRQDKLTHCEKELHAIAQLLAEADAISQGNMQSEHLRMANMHTTNMFSTLSFFLKRRSLSKSMQIANLQIWKFKKAGSAQTHQPSD